MINSTSHLESDIKSEENEFIFKDDCDEKFESDLMMSSEVLYCDKCEFMSEVKEDLEQHLNEHLEKFCCEICGLSFSKRHLLNRHNRHKHTVKERKYQCSSQGCDKGEKSWEFMHD
jgi:uncharacterized Zn-finger protein